MSIFTRKIIKTLLEAKVKFSPLQLSTKFPMSIVMSLSLNECLNVRDFQSQSLANISVGSKLETSNIRNALKSLMFK